MLRIGITSRALFNLSSSHSIFEKYGLEAYRKHQISNENIPLGEGQTFPLVKKLLNLNKLAEKDLVEVILLSRNSPDTGLRIFNSIEHHGLNIKKAAFCGGNSPHIYAKSFETHLFLSADLDDCRLSTLNGIPSARIMLTNKINNSDNLLRIAFDGDSVIFSDDSQLIFENYGLEAFNRNEKNLANEPLSKGPFQSFLEQLCILQQSFPREDCPLRIALVTARSAPSHKRVIKTLRDWNIRIDESLFLQGIDKTAFLEDFLADIFFDDQFEICESAKHSVPTGQVINLNSRN